MKKDVIFLISMLLSFTGCATSASPLSDPDPNPYDLNDARTYCWKSSPAQYHECGWHNVYDDEMPVPPDADKDQNYVRR